MKTEDKILKVLGQEKRGLHKAEIARRIGVSEPKVNIALARLEGKGEIELQVYGLTKVYYSRGDFDAKN